MSGTDAVTATTSVTVSGQVVGTTGAGIDAVEVLRVPTDPYLVPVLRAKTDPFGEFSLDGLEGDAREWLYFGHTGYVRSFRASEMTRDARQALPPVTLLLDAEGAALAQTFGALLDPNKSVLVVLVMESAGGPLRPTPASEFQVIFQPPLDVSIHYTDGQAIAFNAVAYNSYQLTVVRNGRPCAPASHPDLVAADGSVGVRPMAGVWTVGPTMACEP
jgi:hypothetical protein